MAVFQSEDGCMKMNSIVAREGLGTSGGVLTAANEMQASSLFDMLISQSKTTATLDSCTCCIIKPHVVKSANVGAVLDIIIRQGIRAMSLAVILFIDCVQ